LTSNRGLDHSLTSWGTKHDYPDITVDVFDGANSITAYLYLNLFYNPKTLLIVVAAGSEEKTKIMVDHAYKKIGLRLNKIEKPM